MSVVLFATLLLSCSGNETSEFNSDKEEFQKFKSDWLAYDLSKLLNTANSEGTIKSYLFSKSDLISLLENKNFNDIRFVLGITQNELDVKIQASGINNINILNSVIFKSVELDAQINNLSTINSSYSNDNQLVRNHLISTGSAFNYINDWNSSISLNNIENTVSYNGHRINHFSIERNIVEEIMNFNNFQYLAVVLGVNELGKLTTVLVGMDNNKKLIISDDLSRTGEGGGGIFDKTKPCPPDCGD